MASLKLPAERLWGALKPYFEVDLSPPARLPVDQAVDSIRRSYVVMLLAIGILGVMLPVVLIVGERFIVERNAIARGSLSAYYFSSMGDYLVAMLVIVGFCLLIYRIFNHILDNTLTVLAAVAAICVAFFPAKGCPQSELHKSLGADNVQVVHYCCAATLFVSLRIVSWIFGYRELKWEDRPKFIPGPHPSARVRAAFHWICAGVVTAALLVMAIHKWHPVFGDLNLFVGESAALIAFGVSWLYKGLEWDTRNPSMTPRRD